MKNLTVPRTLKVYSTNEKGVRPMADDNTTDGSGVQTSGDLNPTPDETPAAPAPDQGNVPSPEEPKED